MQPESVQHALKTAETLVLQGRHAEAVAAFDTALLADQRSAVAFHGKGVALANLGQIEAAREVLLRAVEIDERQVPLPTYHFLLEILVAATHPALRSTLAAAQRCYPGDLKIRQLACDFELMDFRLTHWEEGFIALHPFNPEAERSNRSHVGQRPRFELWRVRKEELALRCFLKRIIQSHSLPPDLSRILNSFSEGRGYAELKERAAARLDQEGGLYLLIYGVLHYFFGRMTKRQELSRVALQAFATALNVRASALAAYFVGLVGSELGESGVNPDECFRFATKLDPRLPEPYYELGTRLQATGQDMASIPFMNSFMQLRREEMEQHPLGRLGVRFITETNSYAFGHMTDLPRVVAMARRLGIMPDYKIIWIAPEGWVANYALLEHWRGYFEIVTDHSEISRYGLAVKELELDTSFFTLPNGHTVHTRIALPYMQREWELRGLPPLISLNESERERGVRAMSELGLPAGAWFVALHARAAKFKGDSAVGGFNGHRLVDERTYAAAVKEIVGRGGFVVRLGEEPACEELRLPNLIDYAGSASKADWLDLYILSNCRFLLGSSSGLTPGAGLFGRPTVATNFSPTPFRNDAHSIVLPKLIWNERLGRLVSFRELFQPPIFEMENGAMLGQLGYRFIDNTGEEIRQAVIEMLERMEGRLSYSEEEERMQDEYRRMEPEECGRAYLARLARYYLFQHRELLTS